jgi:hypothetical protein
MNNKRCSIDISSRVQDETFNTLKNFFIMTEKKVCDSF